MQIIFYSTTFLFTEVLNIVGLYRNSSLDFSCLMPSFWNVRYEIHKNYVADRLKKLRGCGQHFFSGTIYSRRLQFLQVIYERFDSDLTQEFLIHDLYK